MSSPSLKLEQFSVYTLDRETLLLQSIDLEIEDNQFYIVLGSNGAGKSTFLLALQQEVNRFYTEGKKVVTPSFIPLLPQQVEHYFVGQTPWEEFVLTWESQYKDRSDQEIEHKLVSSGNSLYKESLDNDYEQMQLKIEEVVNLLNIKALLHRPLYELSGGQLQLIALASTLLMNAPLILIDEMTAMVDQATRGTILRQIRQVQALTNCTIVYVTHDEQELIETDKVLYVHNKQVNGLSYQEWLVLSHQRLQVEASESIKTNPSIVLVPPSTLESDTCVHESLQVSHIKLPYSTTLEQYSYTFLTGALTLVKGENGAGKTSLLKAIVGELMIKGGTIQFDRHMDSNTDSNMLRQRTFFGSFFNSKALKHISYCPQFLEHYWSKETVIEECIYVAKCYKLQDNYPDKKQLEAHIHLNLSYFNIDSDLYHRRIYTLSTGQQRKLALAICFMVERRWIVLDEPYAYLDIKAQDALTMLIEKRVNKGCAIILVSHVEKAFNVDQVQTIAIQRNEVKAEEKAEFKREGKQDIQVKAKGEGRLRKSDNSLHPLVLLLSLMILGLTIFVFGQFVELVMLLVAIVLFMVFKLKSNMIKTFYFIFMYSLYMVGIGLASALDFTSTTFNPDTFNTFMLYALKLIVLLLLSYPLMSFISPFKLMRVLQQAGQRLNLKEKQSIALYSVTILFRFVVLLQQLWTKLTSLYRIKYKKGVIQAAYSFFIHYLRECLLIAETIIISYELRKPLQLSKMIYRVQLQRRDLLFMSSIAVLCMLIIYV